MPRKIDPNTLTPKHGVLPSKSVDDNAFLYPERDVDPLRVHLHDPSRAHMASTIGIVDAADCYISDEVEGALQEICSGWGAGRMNGLVEGGYLVSPTNGSGNPPYPTPTAAAGLLIKLVEPATGNPSTVLIGSHTVDISGAEYNFATGTDPVGGASTSIAGTYYLYVETDSTSPDYRGLVASTTLPTVASEKILIAQITHDGTDITSVVDCRYFVANLDRKLPFTLRSGIPTGGVGTNGTFGGENADTWGEALFQTLEAALFWITNYDGPGDTQEEKATVIVRGRQILTQNYNIPAGVCLQGSGPDAQIVWQGTGNLFTLAGDDIRINDIRFTLDNDLPVDCIAIATLGAGGLVKHFSMERCTFDKETTSLDWAFAINATNTGFWSLSNCNLMAGRNANSIMAFTTHTGELVIADCNFNGIGVADSAILIKQPGIALEASITDCTFANLTVETGVTNGTAIYYANNGATAANDQYLRVSGCNFGTVHNGIYSELGQNVIEGNNFTCIDQGNPGNAVVGIHINGDSQNIAATVIENCVIENNRVYCLKVGGSSSWVVDSEPTGILIEGRVFAPKVTNNTVVGDWINTNPGNTGSAIFGSAIGFHQSTAAHLLNPSEGVIANNFITNNVIIEQAAQGLTFTGNQVVTEEPTARVPQLLVGAGSKDATITGNVFVGNHAGDTTGGATVGVQVYGDRQNVGTNTVRTTLTGNTFTDHTKAAIRFIGAVEESTIQGNTMETVLAEYTPSAEGIALEGQDPVGSPENITITGNQIRKFVRGVRVSGYLQNNTINEARNIVVSNNIISEISEPRDGAPYSEDNPLGTNQGILFELTYQATATGNNIAAIGVPLKETTGLPDPVAGADYYGIGIHAWWCNATSITGNTIHELRCHKSNASAGQPFNMGIYLANSGWGSGSAVNVGPDVVADNTITSDFANNTNRLNTLAAIGYLATQRGPLGTAQPPVIQEGLHITGNTCRTTADSAVQATTDQVPSSFYVGNSNQGPGACGIMVVANYQNSVANVTCVLDNVRVSDNQVSSYGTKGVFCYLDGPEDQGVGAGQVSISDNTITGGSQVRTTYVNAQTIQMDGGIAVLARGFTLFASLEVKGNAIRQALYSGISFGMVPVNAHTTPTSLMTFANTAVSDNTIDNLRLADSGTFSETFGVFPRLILDTSQTDAAKVRPVRNFNVVNNRIGSRPQDPFTQNTGVDWGVLFALSDVESVPSRAALQLAVSSVVNNQINTQYAAIASMQDATTGTAARLEDITISNNRCFRIPTAYAAGGEYLSLYSSQITLSGGFAEFSNINVLDNVTAVWRNAASGAAAIRGLSVECTDSPALNNLRITGNTLDSTPNYSFGGTYAESAVALVTTDVPIANSIVIDNNLCVGAITFIHESDDPNVSRLSVQSNTIGSPSETPGGTSYGSTIPLLLRVQGTGPAPTSHWTRKGLEQCVVSGNLITAHNDGTSPNTAFQFQFRVGNVNAHNVAVSNNVFDLQNAANVGGLVVEALQKSHTYQWDVSGNQLMGGGKPHIYYAGDGEAIANQWQIDNNQCSVLSFPDGGWNAAGGHPDSVILFEGSAVSVNDREGDEDISISGNEFLNIKSTRPDVISPGGCGIEDTPGNAAIYFGPNPDMIFTDGAGSESWKAVRNLRIDDNRMAHMDIDVGITVNVYAVKFDVSNVSVCRNMLGHPTKNVTDLTGSFITPSFGIYFLGKLLYQADTDPSEAGRQGMSQINVDDNQMVLWNSATQTELGGITIEWESQWDNNFPLRVNNYAYKAQSISVSNNQINLRGLYVGVITGITVMATSDMHNFRMDGNNIANPQTLDGSAGGDFTYGIKLGHQFQGNASKMIEVTPYTGTQETAYGDEGGVFLTGEVSNTNPDLALVRRNSDQALVSCKTVSWENLSVSNNSVLGDCRFSTLVANGLPHANGAFVLQLVHYTGTILVAPAVGTRKQTMLPIYNFTFKANKVKNDRVFNPETTTLGTSHVGFRILTAPLNGGHSSVTENMSGLYRGWNFNGNVGNWYCMTSASAWPSTAANTLGFDVSFDLGGTPAAGRIRGICQENYAAQDDNGPTQPGDKASGWNSVLSFDENLNDNPWMFPI